YVPVALVTSVRTPWSCGDEIVTVTPGTGLPSRVTVPVRFAVVWAKTGRPARRTAARTANNRCNFIPASFAFETGKTRLQCCRDACCRRPAEADGGVKS